LRDGIANHGPRADVVPMRVVAVALARHDREVCATLQPSQ
jgi:hypothetical protein